VSLNVHSKIALIQIRDKINADPNSGPNTKNLLRLGIRPNANIRRKKSLPKSEVSSSLKERIWLSMALISWSSNISTLCLPVTGCTDTSVVSFLRQKNKIKIFPYPALKNKIHFYIVDRKEIQVSKIPSTLVGYRW
jgi:hypothetical protein